MGAKLLKVPFSDKSDIYMSITALFVTLMTQTITFIKYHNALEYDRSSLRAALVFPAYMPDGWQFPSPNSLRAVGITASAKFLCD